MNQNWKTGKRTLKMRQVVIAMMLLVAASSVMTGCQMTEAHKTEGQATTQTSQSTASKANTTPPVSSEKDVVWGQQIGSLQEDLCVSIAVDSAGNSVMAGYTKGDVAAANKGSRDILISRVDASGKVAWTLQQGTEGDDAATSVVLTKSGDALVTGTTSGKLAGENAVGRFFVEKISKDGKILWTKQYGTEDRAGSNAIHLDNEENIYIAGATNGVLGEKNFGASDAYVSKLDSTGKVLWTSQWGTDGAEDVTGIDIDSEGNIYALGSTSGIMDKQNYGISDFFVSKLSAEGQVLFSKQYGSAGIDTPSKVLVSQDGAIYVTGSTSGDFADKQIGSGDSVFLKLNAKGDLEWQKQFGSNLWDGIHCIQQSVKDPTQVIIGGCQNYSACQAFLRKYDAAGNEIWVKNLIPEFSACGREFGLDAQGFIYQIGGVHGKLYGDRAFEGIESDVFVYKIVE